MILDLLILSACTALSAFVLAKFIKYIVLFSKIGVSLLGAVVLIQFVTLIPGNGVLNYVAWAAILMAAFFLLGLLPRVNLALSFLLNLFLISMVGTIVIQTVLPKLGGGVSINEYILLAIYAVGAVIAFRVLLDQVKGGKDFKFFLLRILDRLVASAINTVSLFYAILQTVNLPDNIPLILTAAAITTAVFYILDLFLFNRISGMATGRKMPSEIRYLLTREWKFSLPKFDFDFSSGDYDRDYSSYDEQQKRNRELDEYLWASQKAMEEEEYFRKQIESANRYYEENYS